MIRFDAIIRLIIQLSSSIMYSILQQKSSIKKPASIIDDAVYCDIFLLLLSINTFSNTVV